LWQSTGLLLPSIFVQTLKFLYNCRQPVLFERPVTALPSLSAAQFPVLQHCAHSLGVQSWCGDACQRSVMGERPWNSTAMQAADNQRSSSRGRLISPVKSIYDRLHTI
jgi:hypothetical protein